MNSIHSTFRNQGLVRPQQGRVLGGVVAGLGRRFGIDPWPARLLFVLILMVIPGSQILIYPILWILMPSEQTDSVQTDARPSDPRTTGPSWRSTASWPSARPASTASCSAGGLAPTSTWTCTWPSGRRCPRSTTRSRRI